VCAPRAPKTCGENVQLSGFCAVLGPDLRQLRNLPDALPECPKRSHDIVFLVDGSGSIGARDFDTMKGFIAEVMRRFQGTDTQVTPRMGRPRGPGVNWGG
ncbi:integrin alpha-D-like, partial [Neopelma chrysocephalum]|uniref:integrin alpha-D-like n=1 Tax=Neopelma chrysocephalum TaxID=114329 RepID=UPI000FCD128E